jgi:hypothetical protein
LGNPIERLAHVFEANHSAEWALDAQKQSADTETPMTAEVMKIAATQLKKMASKDDKGTKAEALKRNEDNISAAAAFDSHQSPELPGDFPDLIVDGKGNAALRAKVAAGELPPTPFATHGMQGWNEDALASWFREWCAVGAPKRARRVPRIAWDGGRTTSNTTIATEAFRARTSKGDSNSNSTVKCSFKKARNKTCHTGGNSTVNCSFSALQDLFEDEGLPPWVEGIRPELEGADAFWK